MSRPVAAQYGFSMMEMLIVIVLFSIIVGIAIVRFPRFCAGVDTAAEVLASDMRLAKSLAQNNQKDYSVELLTKTGSSCYAATDQYDRYQIIDKSDGSIYKSETKTWERNVAALPLDGTACGGGSRYEQKFIFASDGTEKTEAQTGNAAGNRIRIQSTSQGGCPRNYDVSVEPTTGKITITKNGP